ncbi:PspC domain-containing protein [Bacillus kexueae]|uniref:PspC domain-containing protein n=1 Tax=Aeribacillus kexueae TaxID=2078952 RepID=UPI001FAF67F1|nr:PspC domain-containing protein [Bacillus kexueae]
MRRLYRSQSNKRLGGVLGGIAQYFGVDPSVVRLVFIILLVVTSIFPMALIYGAAYLLIPEEKSGVWDDD